MSCSNATNVSPSSSISMLMTTQFTPLILMTNYTEASDFINDTNDINNEEKEYTPYKYRLETYIVPIIFFFIFLIGLIGNGVLCLTILRHKKMRNVPNMYILSVAFGDLLVIVIYVPFICLVYIWDYWPFGLLVCKICECAKDISVGVSVFTLTALSADRYSAIVNAKRKLHVTGRSTRVPVIVMVLIWILAIMCAIPGTFSYLRIFKVHQNVTFCVCYPFPEEFGLNYPKVIVTCRFFIYYVIPLSIIAVLYTLMARHLMRSTRTILSEMQGQVRQVQARKKVAKMVMTFIIMFGICFLPQHIFMLWFYFHSTSQKDYNDFWHYFRILGFCLAFTNSCINPITLYCGSATFRKYFNRYLLCCAMKKMRKRHRLSSGLNSHGRGQNISLVNSRKYSTKTRKERLRLSIMAGNIHSMIPIKDQETVTLSTCPRASTSH